MAVALVWGASAPCPDNRARVLIGRVHMHPGCRRYYSSLYDEDDLPPPDRALPLPARSSGGLGGGTAIAALEAGPEPE